jgi:hypothetical protein
MLAITNLRILCSNFVRFHVNTWYRHSFNTPVNRLVDEQIRMRIIMKRMGARQATLWFSVFIVAHQRFLFFAFSCSPQRLADSPVGIGPRHSLCEWVNAAVRSHLPRAQMNLIV